MLCFVGRSGGGHKGGCIPPIWGGHRGVVYPLSRGSGVDPLKRNFFAVFAFIF
jgi:hypothetical protein